MRARFVDDKDFAASTTRKQIWAQYELGRDLLRSKVRVHCIWIGGSFTTSKLDPRDMDAVFYFNQRDYDHLSADDKTIVSSFIPGPGPLGTPVRGHGLDRLDSFLVEWRPVSGSSDPRHEAYLNWRGYWDDWWQRDRYNPKGQGPNWRDALPVRGFLEVDLDAYDR